METIEGFVNFVYFIIFLDEKTGSVEGIQTCIPSWYWLGAADYVMVKGSIHISDTQNASANIKTNTHQHSPHSNNCNNSTHWYWTNYNTSSVRSAMAELSLTPMRDPSDPKPVTTVWDHWRSAVLDVATWYCSTNHTRLQRNSHQAKVRARPWISPELLKEIKEIHKLHRKFLLTQAQEQWREYAVHPSQQHQTSLCHFKE